VEGFVSGYDLPRPTTASPQDDERSEGAAFSSRPSKGLTSLPVSAPDSEGSARRDAEPGGALSADTLDRLADLVVRRMSERVVREIAWEVIPGVAETIVRQRIKELEERES
jgi:hypothetical protein